MGVVEIFELFANFLGLETHIINETEKNSTKRTRASYNTFWQEFVVKVQNRVLVNKQNDSIELAHVELLVDRRVSAVDVGRQLAEHLHVNVFGYDRRE